jgi:hypothetical protein
MNDKLFSAANRPKQRRHAVAVCALTIGVSLMASAAAVATAAACSEEFHSTDPRSVQHRAAVQAFLAQRYATAYGRFAQLADEGDASSALIALMMVCHGPSMFGSDWSATQGQLQRWGAMAVHDVDEHSLLIAEHDRGE